MGLLVYYSMSKIVNNEICGINGCNEPADTSIYFSLGFSANFCKECANALVAKGLGMKGLAKLTDGKKNAVETAPTEGLSERAIFESELVSSIRNDIANLTKIQEYETEDMKNQDPQDVF